MAEATTERISQKPMDEVDLVRHHYNRRALWGTDSVLYRRTHPIDTARFIGNYQNWQIDTGPMVPADAESPYGEPARLFYSDDLTLWLSRRRESMPYFVRNCNADELHVISEGHMTYETDFGVIDVGERDLLVIPKGVTYRVLLEGPRETRRMIYESRPEIFLVPAEMVEHVYHKGRPAVPPSRLQRPRLLPTRPAGAFEVRVKYEGAFSDFLGDTSTILYDFYPLDTEILDGTEAVFKFGAADIEKLGTTPVPFLGGAYLDNRANLAWTLHLTGGGAGHAPVHRNADVDELRYHASGPRMGAIQFSPQGVDHGAGRGYTRAERNRASGPYDEGDIFSAYTLKALKGTSLAHQFATPCMC
jgi:homogentisate 1,2-dioxygenase